MKAIICEMRNMLDSINSILDITEKISEFEDLTIEIVKNKALRKKFKTVSRASVSYRSTSIGYVCV